MFEFSHSREEVNNDISQNGLVVVVAQILSKFGNPKGSGYACESRLGSP